MASLLGQPAFRSIPAPAGTKVAHPIGRVGPRRGGGYLAEEGENALVLLKELGDGEAATLDAPQRVEEQVSVKGALALLRPHVDLLLMVGEGAVIPVLTVLLVYHVCKEATATFRQAGGQPVGPPRHPPGSQHHTAPSRFVQVQVQGQEAKLGNQFSKLHIQMLYSENGREVACVEDPTSLSVIQGFPDAYGGRV